MDYGKGFCFAVAGGEDTHTAMTKIFKKKRRFVVLATGRLEQHLGESSTREKREESTNRIESNGSSMRQQFSIEDPGKWIHGRLMLP
jgi:hypothetical protein